MGKVLHCIRPVIILTSALHFKSSSEVHGSLSLESQSTSRYHGQLHPSLWGTINGQGLISFAFVHRSKQYLL